LIGALGELAEVIQGRCGPRAELHGPGWRPDVLGLDSEVNAERRRGRECLRWRGDRRGAAQGPGRLGWLRRLQRALWDRCRHRPWAGGHGRPLRSLWSRSHNWLVALPEVAHDQLDDALERLLNADPLDGGCLEDRHCRRIEGLIHLIDAHDVSQVTFVELQDMGELAQLHPLEHEVLLEVPQRLGVGLRHRPLRVRDEDHAVSTPQNQLPGRVVVDLTRNGVQLQSHLHATDASDFDG